jgi:REP element-mobilizing transposase RayT
MARHLRVEFPGAIYHVACRMIGDGRLDQSRLFVDDKDRQRFVDRLADRGEQYNIRLYLFVCMTNHFHLVFETPEANCSKFMHSLSTAYTVYYNLRHGRHGHLLDGRFKAKLVGGDDYLLALTRYVHLNPVWAGEIRNRPIAERVRYLRQYPWSTYRSYIGEGTAFDFVECGPLLAMMHGKRRLWAKRYREFVETGLAEDDAEFKTALKQSPRSIGSDSFRAWVDGLYQKLVEGHSAREDVSFRHVTEPLPVSTILATVSEALGVAVEMLRKRRRNSSSRAIAARMLIRFGGQTQRQTAAHLNMGTGGAVSAQVRRLPALLDGDRRLRRTVQRIEERLEGARGGNEGPHRSKC